MSVELGAIVEKYDCRYFAENDTGASGDSLRLALRSPFNRLYALNRSAKLVAQQRQWFGENDRVQIFTWTHPGSWVEVIRLVPLDQPSMFWFREREFIAGPVRAMSFIRPAHLDVLLFEPSDQRTALKSVEKYYGYTHTISMVNDIVFAAFPKRVK